MPAKKSLKASYATNLVAQLGHGSVRDTERFLGQLATTPMALTNIKEIQRIIGLASETAVMDFTDALSSRDNAAAYAVNLGVATQGVKPRLFATQLVNYWRELWVLQSAGPDHAGQIIASADYAPDPAQYIHHAPEIVQRDLKKTIDAFEPLAAADVLDTGSSRFVSKFRP